MNNMKIHKYIYFIVTITLLFSLLTGCAPTTQTTSSNVTSTTDASESLKDNVEADNTSSTTHPAPMDELHNDATSSPIKVHYIDVGQADSILIQDGETSMLIDAGNNDDSDLVVNYIRAQKISKLDYVIGTHPHEDHIGGLDAVIKNFDIGKIYMPQASNTTQTFTDVLSAVKNKGLKITTPIVGSSFTLHTATATILAPNSTSYEDLNNYSIVIKLTYGNTSFLFLGDAEDISEDEMIGKDFDLAVDVLKVGHHGSSSSTTSAFLRKVNPKYAVITVGQDNKYGHPHKETMELLETKGITVFRTDENGTIVATSDGKDIVFDKDAGSYTPNGTLEATAEKSTQKVAVAPAVQKPTQKATAPPAVANPTPKPTATSNKTVYFTPKGKSYHYDNNCRTLARSKTILSGTLQEALDSGHADPCDVCAH